MQDINDAVIIDGKDDINLISLMTTKMIKLMMMWMMTWMMTSLMTWMPILNVLCTLTSIFEGAELLTKKLWVQILHAAQCCVLVQDTISSIQPYHGWKMWHRHIKHQLNSNKISDLEVKVIKLLNLRFYDAFEAPISSIKIMSIWSWPFYNSSDCFMISTFTQCESPQYNSLDVLYNCCYLGPLDLELDQLDQMHHHLLCCLVNRYVCT